jgi:ACDE family multidrug resistance protein
LFGVLSYLADVLEKNFGVAELPRGFLIAIPVAASAATSFVAGTTLQRQIAGWAKPMVTGGLSLIALAMAVEPFFATTVPAWALVILVLQGIGTGAVLPAVNTLVTSAVTRKERGVVTSLYGSVRFFGVALGPPAFSLAMGHRFAVFWSAAALALAAGAVAWWFINAQEMLPARLRQAGPPS